MLTSSSYQRRLYGSPAMQRALDAVTAAEPFDVIQAESSLMTNFRFRSGAALVLDEHNIEYQLLERTHRMELSWLRKLYNLAEYVKFRREERAAWARCDGCVVTSALDSADVPLSPPATRTLPFCRSTAI